MFERSEQAGNRRPVWLPQIWRERRPMFQLDAPYHFIADVDHSGGNSGSPVINQRGEWFGLQHDGNHQNLGTQYVYSDTQARMIALYSGAIIQWLRVILSAEELVSEIGAKQ